MNLQDITPLILTYNEEANIGRTLEALGWASEVIVIDSKSSDKTARVAQAQPHMRFIEREFDTHASQWNFGLDAVKTRWVLTLDADYYVSQRFLSELKELPDDNIAYSASLRFCIDGEPLSSSILPPRIVLFPKESARYFDDGHTQRLQTDLEVRSLQNEILHDDRKSFARWFRNQQSYMSKEAATLVSTPLSDLSWPKRIRRAILFAPILIFFYCYFLRGGILEGLPGLRYAAQRCFAEIILSVYVVKEYIAPRGA